MKTRYVLPFVLACCMPALAQNIDQSVQVTNEYETKFADFQKLGVDSQVPDSLYEFDYDFDYSVFDSPYRGSYEFTPYEIRITPDPMAYDGSRFLLRAGAGYTLRPVLDLYWTAVDLKDFTFGLTNNGAGYCGRYADRAAASDGSGALGGFGGYDLSDSFSLGGHWILRGADLRFKAGYDGIFTGANDSGDVFMLGSMNSGHASVEIASSAKSGTYFSYLLGAAYRFGADSRLQKYASAEQPSPARLGSIENNLRVYGSIGPVVNGKYAFLLDFNFDVESLDRPEPYVDVAANHAVLTPHVAFSLGIFDLDAGADIDYLWTGSSGSFNFAPELNVSLDMFSGSTKAYAGVTGGRKLLDVYGIKSAYHFHSALDTMPVFTREKFGAFLGIEGRLGGNLQYDLHGGYSNMGGVPLEYLRKMSFADAEFVYAALDMKWISERINAEAGLDWRHITWYSSADAFAPAELSGDFSFSYNWLRRIYAGINLEGATSRRTLNGSLAEVPGYVDLGLDFEYRFSPRLGAWMKAGNLLGMRIEKHPGYVMADPYITLGVLLKL